MKKIAMMFTVMILALNLFGQQFTYAAANQYDNLAYGKYDIIAKALNADSDAASGAAGFIKEAAELTISEKGIFLTITVPHNDMAEIAGMQVEGTQPAKDGEQWTYKIASLKQLLKAQVQYEVPALNMKHDVPFRFSLEGLDRIPQKEAPEVEQPEVEKPEAEKPEVDEDKEPTEDEKVPALKKGYYKLKTAYLHASKDEASSMGRYLSNPVFVNIQDQKIELTITVNDHKTVTKLQVGGKNATTTKVDGNTRYETFTISSLAEPISAYVEYQAPYGGSVHHGNASFRIDTDLTTAKSTNANEQPGYGINTEQLNLTDGLYSIDAAFINAKNGESSSMARYLGDKAYISVKDGKMKVYFLINDNGTVTKLNINDQQSVEKIVNGKQTLVAFDVNPLTTKLKGYAEYEAPFNGSTHYGNAGFDISLNKATVQEVKQLPIENEQPKEDEKEEVKPKPKPETPKTEDKEPVVKGYKIDYVIKHATADETSAADKFFVKPGILLKKDGKNYLQLTINNWSMIDSLKVNGQSVTVIKVDQKADTAIVQFQVPTDLSKVLQLSMKVTVPGLYETTHEARLVMDAKSVVEDQSGNDYVVQAPSAGNDEALEKPVFGKNETAESGKAGAQKNPQTGDKSKLVLYSILLLASLTLLVVQYRKRQLN